MRIWSFIDAVFYGITMSLKAGGNRSKPGGGNTAGAPSSGAGGSGGGRQNLGRSVTIKSKFSALKRSTVAVY